MTEPLIVKNADSYDLDTPEHMDNDVSVQMCPNDSREQLEADVRFAVKAWKDSRHDFPKACPDVVLDSIFNWLNRQAAITRRETLLENPLHNNPYVGLVRGKQWERKQASDYYCGKCGYPVTDHDSYCPECGGALHKAANKPNSQFDVLKTAENAENATSKDEIHDFDDSREQLEADVANILRNAASHTSANTSIGDMLRYTVPGSGAAPWQLEEDACEALASIAERQIAELTSERDKLQEAIDAMNNGQFYSMYKAKCDECEQLKKVARTQAESFKKLECELAGKDG